MPDPREVYAEFPFPLAGIDVSTGYDTPPPWTTQAGVNVRSFDPLTLRARGGSRPGITKYADQLPNGAHLIQSLGAIVTSDPDALIDSADLADDEDGTDDPSDGARNPGRTVRTGGSGRQPNRHAGNKKKKLTITARSFQKPTDSDFRVSGKEFDVTGLQPGDSVDTVTLSSSGFAAGSAPGPYPITPSDAVGPSVDNYKITYKPGTLTVTDTPTGPTSSVSLFSSVAVGLDNAGSQSAGGNIVGAGQFSRSFTFNPGAYPLLNQSATITMTVSIDGNGSETYFLEASAPGLQGSASVFTTNNSWIWGTGVDAGVYVLSGIITG